MIAIVVINYRRPVETLGCLEAIADSTVRPFEVFLVDNAPVDGEQHRELVRYIDSRPNINYRHLDVNIGFAAACNEAIGEILGTGRYLSVVLLNNDALPRSGWLDAWTEGADGYDLAAIPMYRLAEPAEIDSLGITLYQSGLAANRTDPAMPLLGPCGGAACLTLRSVREILQSTGEIFPADYFCYAEDTDLAVRAAMLGFR